MSCAKRKENFRIESIFVRFASWNKKKEKKNEDDDWFGCYLGMRSTFGWRRGGGELGDFNRWLRTLYTICCCSHVAHDWLISVLLRMKEHHQFHKEANTLFWCGVAFTFVWRGITAISGYFSYRLDGISDEKKNWKKSERWESTGLRPS